jgi:hypothetical protein
MWKATLAGAVALATIGSFSVAHDGSRLSTAQAQEVIVTEGQIVRLKHALKLTPLQARHWYAVEATLRGLAHRQQQYRVASADAGYVERAKAQVAGYTVTAVAMQRLRSAAGPLVNSLTDEQKSAGRDVLSSMGVSF